MRNHHFRLINQEVPKTIMESWKRSRKSEVSETLNSAPLVLTEEDINKIKQHDNLYQSFSMVYSRMEREIEDYYAFGLADERGRMIGVRMKGKLHDQLREANFYPGANWHEEVTGTNAIGTALAAKQPVTIHTAEHFCDAWKAFSCAGVPIFHPIKKKLIGVLDLTSNDEHFHKQSLLLTKAVAEGIHLDMLNRVHRKTSILKEVFMKKKHETQQDWLLAIDEDGDMVASNHSSKSFQYIWKSAFDWDTYFQQLQSKKKTDNEHAPLPFLHGQPEGKVHSVIDNEKIIGIIVQLPKHSSRQPTTKMSTQTSQHEDGVIGQSAPFLSFFSKIKKVAPSHVPVLLTGESGTGKEVFSQTIHRLSDRREKPFITFNCSSLNHELAASELFGYAPGSFTGGLKEGKKGLFEAADGGVLFLDEIGEIPLTVQPLLLRVLQEKEVLRVGEYKPRKVDVRIIAATNRDLKQMIQEGTFREDLYYRLSVINLPIPSLRERKEDILPLADYFLEQCQLAGRIQFSESVVQVLQTYDWPGNIRELRNAIEYSVLFVDGDIIEIYHLPDYLQELRSTPFVLVNNLPDIGTEKHERENIIQMLKQTNFNVTKAAKMLGFSRGTLYNRLKKYNISY
ncbi:sigma-54-dependent Fis family transcriptional regulator [Bacillus sp. FJAT-42315]|uniref:sigma-54-dependent Fis family transcriptional regulator n=1 Tax=Bacillus sp. FJAT-42315 TaxID=2014077 RepID=UPI0018E23BCB|nr:sigma-54-dependent Fis family transcriptional regulator [Bacillus sp. FJAT-42315]